VIDLDNQIQREIMPLSQGEIDGVHENFLPIAMESPDRFRTGMPTATSRSEYIQRICRGGLPLAVTTKGRARGLFSSLGPSTATLLPSK
jgi:hypothetical protein